MALLTPSEPAFSSQPHPPETILVVDDNPTNLQLLIEMLSSKGYRVRSSPNGSLALKSIQAKRPDLILLDILMPGMNGLELCRVLKSDGQTQGIPILFISALNEAFDKVEAFEIGGADYISKPFQMEEVLARVQYQLQIHRLQRELQQEIAVRRQAELRYALATQAAKVGVWDWDLVTDAFYLDPQFQESLGYGGDQLALQFETWLSRVHPSERVSLQAEIQKHINAHLPDYTFEHRLHHPDGSWHWMLMRGRVVRNDQQQPLRMIGTLTDISERKQTEETKAWLAAIVESTSDSVISTTLDGEILSWNHGAEEIYGYKAQETLGQSIRILSSVTDPYACRGTTSREVVHACKGGQLVDILQTVSPIRDARGQEIALAWVGRDITGRKHLDRMKNEFISIVSHELRTPLTSIHGSLSALVTGKLGLLSDKGQRLLTIAADNVARLNRLINDILNLERLGSGKVNSNKQVCQLAEIMEQAQDLMEPMASEAYVTLDIRPPEVALWADPDQLTQVLSNLISNAVKFSPPHTTVLVATELKINQVLLQVRDQGRGIPPHMLEKVFEPFQQVDSSDSRQKGGTGLGLAICQRIIEQHGGRIWAQNNDPDPGSTFWIQIPRLPSPVKSASERQT